MEFIPKTPENQEQENADQEELATPAGADILSEFGNADDVIVHERIIEINNKPRTFYFRELDYKNLNKVNSRKWRKGAGGALEFDVMNADNTVTAWTLHLAVVTNTNEGTKEEPNWVPLWSLDQLLGKPEVRQGKRIFQQAQKGLLDNGHESARLFIFELLSHAWEVNPTLNPMILASAAE